MGRIFTQETENQMENTHLQHTWMEYILIALVIRLVHAFHFLFTLQNLCKLYYSICLLDCLFTV